MKNTLKIQKATGNLGILTPGLGAVATTFIAGVLAINKGFAQPIGSLTQMGRIRIGKRTKVNKPYIKNFIPLQNMKTVTKSLSLGPYTAVGMNMIEGIV